MTRPQDDPAALPCPNCGYDLRGGLSDIKATTVTCPECGARWLRSQLAAEGRRPDQHPRRARWILVAALSPSILSVLAVGSVLVDNRGDLRAMLTFALMTPIILFPPLAMLRYGHHRSWRKRLPRIIAFIILYLLINAVLFVVLTVALIIVIACFDPNHFTA